MDRILAHFNSRSTAALPWIFFSLGFFTVTWDRLGNIPVAGVHLRLSYAFFLLAFIFAAWQKRHSWVSDFRELILKDYPVFILLLAIYFLALLPLSYFPVKTLMHSIWILFDLFVIWLTARWIAVSIPREWLFFLVFATILFHSAVILVDQFAFSYGYNQGFLGFNQAKDLGWSFSRPAAFSYEPSYIANFLCMGILFLLPTLLEKNKNRLWILAGMAFSILALICTTSRTGWFGLALGLFVFCVLLAIQLRRVPWKLLGWFSLILVVGISVFLLFYSQEQKAFLNQLLVSSMFNGTDGSGVSRLRAIQNSITMAKETHWLGTGLGASFIYWASNHVPQVLDAPIAQDRFLGMEAIMSTWWQLMAEGGIPAMILYACFAFFLLRRLVKRWRTQSDIQMLGALTAALVFFLFSAHWISNIARADVWVWYSMFTLMAFGPQTSAITKKENDAAELA